MPEVHLSNDEVLQAALTGVLRHWSARENARKDNCSDLDKWRVDIEGACGEVAVAKFLDRHWRCAVGRVDCADIGDKIEVRHRPGADDDLIVRERNADPNAFYVLVTGESPDFVVRGFIKGREAMAHDEWKRDPGGRGPAWFVPQSALRKFKTKESTQ